MTALFKGVLRGGKRVSRLRIDVCMAGAFSDAVLCMQSRKSISPLCL